MIGYGVYPDAAKKIALDYYLAFWNWHHANIENILNKKIKNPGAVILTHFGLTKKG